MRFSRLLLALAIASALFPGSAMAQRRRQPSGPGIPRPMLRGVFPAGVRAGEAVDLAVEGADLEGVDRLWFDDPGLSATLIKGNRFRVVAARGTAVGHHDVRVLGRLGLSNPRSFVVGDRVEIVEVEPNDGPGRANGVAVNSVVNGRIGAEADVDCFAFEGKKGRRVIVEVEAERVESRLDATLRLLDARGFEIAESRDAFGTDPFLDVTLPADGRYVLKVHDVTYKGSAEHVYRLTLTDGPHLDAVVPAVARGGEPTTFTLIGRNLGEGSTPAPGLVVEGRPLETRTVTLNASEPDGLARGFVLASSASRRGFEYALESASGRSNPVFIAGGVDPVVVEVEPNDVKAQEIAAPCEVSGRFDAPGDLDLYRFRAKKGETFRVEATAEGIGSSADPVLAIQRVDAKRITADLASAEDTPERGDPARFPMANVDASLRWTAPEDGFYQVAVNDLYGSQRGDARLAYRLSVRPERPDFQLFVVPDSLNLPSALNVHAGGRALASLIAVRMDGFAGPIRVEAEGLPKGLRCEPVTILAGQTVAPIVIEAEAGVKPFVADVRLVGRSRFGDRKSDLCYVSGVTVLGPDLSHQALAGGLVWPQAAPAPNGQNNPTSPTARLVRGIVVSVVDPAPLTLTARPAAVHTAPGSRLILDLALTRGAGFTGAVAVSLASTLPGLVVPALNPAAPPAIAANATGGSFFVDLPRTLAPGLYTMILQGTGPYPFSKDPTAKTKPSVTLNEPSNPITIVVQPAPASLAVGKPSKPLRPGGSVDLDVTLTRLDGSLEPLSVSLVGPASLRLKLAAPGALAQPGKPLRVTIQADPASPVGPALGLGFRVSAPSRNEPIDVTAGFALDLVK